MTDRSFRLKFAFLLLAALGGMLLSSLLLFHHQNPAFKSVVVDAICGESGGCQTVNHSPLSTMAGLPLALWGFFLYSTLFVLSAFYAQTRNRLLLLGMLALAGFAFFADIFLFLYMTMVLKTICNLCLLSYVATVVIAVAAFLLYRQSSSESADPALPSLSGFWQSLKNEKISFLPALLLALALVLSSGISLRFWAGNQASASAPEEYLQKAWELFSREYHDTPVQSFDLGGNYDKGAGEPVLTIVEFSDFLCPYCRLAGGYLKELVNKHPREIRVVYRNFPLDSSCNSTMNRQLHKGSCELALAAHCAGQQGKFWDMHDMIFSMQEIFSTEGVSPGQIQSLARHIELNEKQFSACMTGPVASQQIQKDIMAAAANGISGTPTLFVNGRKVKGIPLEFFMELLLADEARRKSAGK